MGEESEHPSCGIERGHFKRRPKSQEPEEFSIATGLGLRLCSTSVAQLMRVDLSMFFGGAASLEGPLSVVSHLSQPHGLCSLQV